MPEVFIITRIYYISLDAEYLFKTLLCLGLSVQVAIDSATPLDDAGGPSVGYRDAAEAYGGYGPMRNYGRLYGSLDFDDVSKHFNLNMRPRIII